MRSVLADPAALVYEPAPQGLAVARAAVAEWLSRRGSPVDPDRLLLTAGTSEAYAYLFALLLDPGDAILVPRPSYPLLDSLARLSSVHLQAYDLRWEGRWSLDLDSVRRAAAAGRSAGPGRARLLVVVYPNNPTGSFLSAEEADGLRQLCSELDLALISDEVFSEYSFEPDPRRAPTLARDGEPLTFCLDGLSKSAGFPQLKLGWIQLCGAEAECRAALSRLELVADTFLSVGAPVQHAAAHLLVLGARVRSAIRARLGANLERLRRCLAGAASCSLLSPEGGWTAVLRLPATRSDEQWAIELLEQDGILVQPGYLYDFAEEAILVLSLLTEPESFQTGVARLLERACA